MPACLVMALTAGLALAFTLAYFNPPGQVTAHCNVCTTAICTQRAANILGKRDVNSPHYGEM